MNFIGEKFLTKHVVLIKIIGELLTKMKRVGTGLGVHMVDKEFHRICRTGYPFANYKIYNVEEDVTKINTNEGDDWKFIAMEKIFY